MTGPGPATLSAALRAAVRDLAEAGVADAARDGRILAAAAAGLSREDMLRRLDDALPQRDLRRLAEAVERRRRGEPVSRIVGVREFWGLEFAITPATLDPRPDSETVVEAVLSLTGTPSPRILDLGTGSGCLLIALLHELPAATGVGTDISPAACEAARANAGRLGVAARAAFVAGNWAEAVRDRFDVVVSNPPYVPSGRIAGLAPEVREHDPVAGLDGGPDGLDAYRGLAGPAARLLREGGLVAAETDGSRAREVRSVFADAGLVPLAVRRDLAGRPRVCLFRGP